MTESLMPEYVSVVCVCLCFFFWFVLFFSLHPHHWEGERRKHVQSEFGDPSVEGLLLCVVLITTELYRLFGLT